MRNEAWTTDSLRPKPSRLLRSSHFRDRRVMVMKIILSCQLSRLAAGGGEDLPDGAEVVRRVRDAGEGAGGRDIVPLG